MTLPLFGAPLVVDINVDPGGNLVDVSLNQPGDFTATTVKPNKVMFVNEVEGVEREGEGQARRRAHRSARRRSG